MTTLLDLLTSAGKYLWTAPAWLLLLIVVNLIGVWLQKAQWFPNLFIAPVLVTICIVLLEFLVDPETIQNRSPHLVIALVGFILGVIAYGLHFAFVQAWRKWVIQQENGQKPQQP